MCQGAWSSDSDGNSVSEESGEHLESEHDTFLNKEPDAQLKVILFDNMAECPLAEDPHKHSGWSQSPPGTEEASK